MGEEDEEFEVIDHSLTSDGIITEYYVKYKSKVIAVPAGEATIIVEKSHPAGSDEEHGEKPEKDDAEKLDSEEDKETAEEKEKRIEQDKKDFGPGGKKQFARSFPTGRAGHHY